MLAGMQLKDPLVMWEEFGDKKAGTTRDLILHDNLARQEFQSDFNSNKYQTRSAQKWQTWAYNIKMFFLIWWLQIFVETASQAVQASLGHECLVGPKHALTATIDKPINATFEIKKRQCFNQNMKAWEIQNLFTNTKVITWEISVAR